MTRRPNFADILANLVGDIATDVRQHVVEEPWFGRAVTREGGGSFQEMLNAWYGEPQKPEQLSPSQDRDVEIER